MTPRQESNLELLVGELRGQLTGLNVVVAEMRSDLKSGLAEVHTQIRATDEWRHEVKDRLEKMDERDVSKAFIALQQSIHDGKTTVRGIMVGVSLAGGAVGATFATFFKSIWAWIVGAV
jgi:hypothetical protein